jgi:hypothetical protein
MQASFKYSRWLGQGLCGECGKMPAVKGHVRCAKCAETHRKRDSRYLNKLPLSRVLARARVKRQSGWDKQGILMVDGKPLTHEVFDAVLAFQGNCCAICSKFFFGAKREKAADHAHTNPDGSGLFRGVLCGRKTGCNLKYVPRLEHASLTVLNLVFVAPDAEPEERRTAAYLLDPPYQRWLAGKKTPRKTLYTVRSVEEAMTNGA